MRIASRLIIGLAVTTACASPDEPDLHTGDPASIALISGDNQTVRPDARLPTTITVEVRDMDDRRLYDARVSWDLHEYPSARRVLPSSSNVIGSVDEEVSFTDANGRTSTDAVAGSAYGWYAVHGRTMNSSHGVLSAVATFVVTDGTQGELRLISGTGQQGPLGSTFSEPLVIELREEDGSPARNTEVRFTNTGYGGAPSFRYIDDQGEERASHYALTNDAGRVSVGLRPVEGGSTMNIATVVVGVPRFGLSEELGFETSR